MLEVATLSDNIVSMIFSNLNIIKVHLTSESLIFHLLTESW